MHEARREDRRRHRLEGRRLQRRRGSTSPALLDYGGRAQDRRRLPRRRAAGQRRSCSSSTSTSWSRPRSRTRSPRTTPPTIKAKIVVEGANGPTTPEAHQHAARARRLRRPRHPGQRRRRHHLVLRVGAGPPRLLLDREGSERTARDEDGARRSTRCSPRPSSTTSTCAPPPTSWPSTASPRSRGCAACTRDGRRAQGSGPGLGLRRDAYGVAR